MRADGRVVECTGLENRQGFIALLGFESLSARHLKQARLLAGFVLNIGKERFEPGFDNKLNEARAKREANLAFATFIKAQPEIKKIPICPPFTLRLMFSKLWYYAPHFLPRNF